MRFALTILLCALTGGVSAGILALILFDGFAPASSSEAAVSKGLFMVMFPSIGTLCGTLGGIAIAIVRYFLVRRSTLQNPE